MLPLGAGGAVLEETITLYLGLKEGEKADFEVVGRASAAFAEAVKEISYILEPGLEVRLEFDSGTEGSLKLKAILKSLHSSESRRAALLAIIGTIGTVLIADLRGYGTGKLLDRLFAPEQREQLSDEDVERIAKAVMAIKQGRIAKAPMQQMFKQLDRDPTIESVGAITKPDDKPSDPVPRSEFQIRAGIAPIVQTSPRTRTTPSTERLTLIRPVLLDSDRPWRFASPLGELPYRMDDKKFLKELLDGKAHLSMKSGIQISARVETDEELEGGVWVPKLRRITKVIRVHKKPEIQDLFSDPKKGNASKAKKRQAKKPKKRAAK
jgi:hypothetical protein